MFRCHFCQQITPPKTTRHSVVIEVREKRYSSRQREFKRGGGRNFRDRDEPTPDRGGQGMEIMREVAACPACAAKQHEVKRVEIETPTPAAEIAPTDTESTPTDTEGQS
jgi:hypothetical protein|tara:strand:+ start:280 stop:606 length:327 start_codon:yes stop_codon:yes gene_type:complete